MSRDEARILVADRSEALANAVRSAGGHLRHPVEVVTCTRVGELPDVMTESGPFDVLVVGPALMTRAGLARVADVHDADPALSVVLAPASQPSVHLRDIVRAGACDLLTAGTRGAPLIDCLERALARKRQLTVATAPAVPGDTFAGATFTVASATGGCGKTFYATNLAYYLAHHTRKRVCIADFDLQFGEVTAALRLRPKYTSHDLVEQLDEADLDAHIEEYLVPHETGVWVLAAPKDPGEADRFTPHDVTRIIDALRRRFDYVVVDTPSQLSEVVLAAFDRSDMLFTLATLDLPSVRNMGVFLTTLQRLKIPTDTIRLVMNKAEDDVGIEMEQVTKLFSQGFSSILPYSKDVSRSINLGLPVLAASPASEVSRKLAAGLAPLLPDGAVAEVVEPERHRRGWFQRSVRPVAAAGGI